MSLENRAFWVRFFVLLGWVVWVRLFRVAMSLDRRRSRQRTATRRPLLVGVFGFATNLTRNKSRRTSLPGRGAHFSAHHMLGGGSDPPQRLHHMLGGGARPPQRLHHMLGGGGGRE